MSTRRFPPRFLWGAATAAYQIEGATAAEGRGASIWDTFTRVPGAILRADTGEVACDHYHRYPQDVELMASLGIAAYRFSTSWSRILPDGVCGHRQKGVNRVGLDFYSRLVDDLLDHDIAPWLTLYHWDLPQALQDRGGWVNRSTAHRFTEFAQTVHAALGDRVRVWSTLNEPWCSAFLGHTAGVHAPGHHSPAEGLVAGHHLLLAHGMATQELRSLAPGADLGLTLNFTVADPADPDDPDDVAAAGRLDAQFNRWFADPVFRGSYPEELWADLDQAGLASPLAAVVQEGDLTTISTPIDTLGVNYYHGELIGSRPDPRNTAGEAAPVDRPAHSPHPLPEGIYSHERGLPRTGQGWEIQPEGLTRLLLRLHRDYAAPSGTRIYVTENGAAFEDVLDPDGRVDDVHRRDFLATHLAAIHDAIAQGAPVDGYFAWSLLDNFEWSWGYSQRFGIVYVDFETQRRYVKLSGHWYSDIAATNRFEFRQPLH